MSRQVTLIGVPLDLGAGRRGVDMGPSAFRVAGIDQKIRSLGYEVVDAGDLPVKIAETQVPGDPHLKYLKEIKEVCEHLRDRGEAIERATSGTAGIHVSFDLDGMDPDYAPGVGTPAPGGLSYREAHLAMEMLADTGRVLSAELVEVNPILDNRNATAILGVELLASLLGKKIL